MAGKNILLIEPGYRNKYPPLGLMKIAEYHGPRGKGDNVVFVKGEQKEVLEKSWDRIYVTSLFTFEWAATAKTLDFALKAAQGQADRVFAGGISVSLMKEEFQEQPKWRGIRFIQGLLDQAPAISLELDDFAEELYSDDVTGTPIEDRVPDYTILSQLEYVYPVHDAYFVYASRGCVRKCTFCGVPKLEGDQRDANPLKQVVTDIQKLHGDKKDLIIMDNNIVASSRFADIIAEIKDLGFAKGDKLRRNGATLKRRVDFNQGVDARILCKNKNYLKLISEIAIDPLRIAFDTIAQRPAYEKSIRFAHEYGIKDLSNYMLYNYEDSPTDLFRRMYLNIQFNEELDIRIFSFPMRYQPVNFRDRSFVGNSWNKYYLRSLQIILQATHGIVSGSPTFFRKAFGGDPDEFVRILRMPHHFIFNRFWYEKLGGAPELEEFQTVYHNTNKDDLEMALSRMSSLTPKNRDAFINQVSSSLKPIMEFYRQLPKGVEREIWEKQKKLKQEKVKFEIDPEKLVEDSGLDENIW